MKHQGINTYVKEFDPLCRWMQVLYYGVCSYGSLSYDLMLIQLVICVIILLGDIMIIYENGYAIVNDLKFRKDTKNWLLLMW